MLGLRQPCASEGPAADPVGQPQIAPHALEIGEQAARPQQSSEPGGVQSGIGAMRHRPEHGIEDLAFRQHCERGQAVQRLGLGGIGERVMGGQLEAARAELERQLGRLGIAQVAGRSP